MNAVYLSSTSGTVVKNPVVPRYRSLSHDGPGLMVQWLATCIQDLPIGARVRVTIERLEDPL